MLCCFHYVLPKDNQSLCLIIKYFLKYFPVQSSAEFVTSRRLQQDLSGPTLTESQSDWARLSSVVRLSAAWKQIRYIFLLLIKYFQWWWNIFSRVLKYFYSYRSRFQWNISYPSCRQAWSDGDNKSGQYLPQRKERMMPSVVILLLVLFALSSYTEARGESLIFHYDFKHFEWMIQSAKQKS